MRDSTVHGALQFRRQLTLKTKLITAETEDIEIVGILEAVVDLLDWLHVPLSEFRRE